MQWLYEDENGDDVTSSSLCRIEFFVDYSWATGHVFIQKDSIDVSPGHYVVVSCVLDGSLHYAHNSKMILIGEMEVDRKLYLAPVEAINAPAFVIEGLCANPNDVIVAEPRKTWCRWFPSFDEAE